MSGTEQSRPIVQGWCPGALRPMTSVDGLVVRLRLPMGRLSPVQIRALSDLSRRYGNGQLDLTSRANLQLRGVSVANHAGLVTHLRAMSLLDADEQAEARRNITLTPFWRTGDDSATIAAELAARLARSDAPALSGKFGFAVDCGTHPVLTGTAADIRIERAGHRLICRADGMATGRPVTPATAVDTAMELAHWFVNTGGVQGNRGRMAQHLALGAQPPEAWTIERARPGQFLPAPGHCDGGVLAAVEFGRTDADLLEALADLGALRLTPWRMVLIEGAAQIPDLPGLIADPRDARLRMDACTGAPDCPQAIGPTRKLARELADRLRPSLHVHVSGCAKGCAHPAPCAVTLVSSGPGRFDLIRNGRAADVPEIRDLTHQTLLTDPRLTTGAR
ncbi:MAG: precorrin-3B synthase [Hyphomicrobiaceae bacterium]